MKSDEPRRRRFRFGLAPKLILLVVLATLIVGAVVGALVLIKSRDTLREQIFTRNLETADLAAQFAAHYADMAQAVARELAARPLIIRAVANGSFAQAGPELVRFLQLNPLFDGVSILDKRGIIRVTGVANPRLIGTSSADRDWFLQATATGKPYLGAPVLSRATGRPNVPYGVPIFDERGDLRGVLVTGISLAALSKAIVETQVGPDARAALHDFRHGGIILAHADPKRILTPFSGRNEAARRLLTGERGTLETINSAGERVLNAFSPVHQVPWGILITQPHKSAFAALDALTRQALLLGGLAILITAFMGGWVALLLSRPILALRDAANALAAGDLSRRVKFSRSDEIGELAQVFDRMADALQVEQTTLRRRAENFFNLSPDLLCVAGFDGYFKTLNPMWEQTLGFTAAELQGRLFIEFVHPDDRRPTREAAARLTSGQDAVAFENRYLCKDGSHRWLTWNTFSVVDEQMIYAVAHDVTERKQAEEILRQTEENFRRSMDDSPLGKRIVTSEGETIYANRAILELYGYDSIEELKTTPVKKRYTPESYAEFRIRREKRRQAVDDPSEYVIDIIRKNGEVRHLQVFRKEVLWDGERQSQVIYQDITERKRAADRESLAREVLNLLNRPEDETDAIRDILLRVKKSQGFEAVGIRLKDGDDFPYFQTDGFPDHFVKVERYLCVRDGEGKIVCDVQGNPVLECMCGNIIRGRTNDALPFFSEGGSFWTNSTTDLLALTTEKDRLACTRNRCNEEGYESVALIPLRSGDEVIGLLQINDRRRNQFTLEMIRFFEGLGLSIGIALSRKRAVEELRETRDYLENLFGYANAPIIVWDPEFKIARFNHAFEHLTGHMAEEVIGKNLQILFPDSSREESLVQINSTLGGEYWESVEIPILRKDGDTRLALWNSANIYAADGETLIATIAQGQDITVRKRQTTELIRSDREKGLLLKEIHHRVKNNLQIIASLLKLSTKYSGDERVEEIFRESQDRIRAMAAVHSMLYKSESFSEINFGEYIRETARQLFRSYNTNPEAISLLINAEDVILSIDTAIPCGLMINELISNALKHALPDGRRGEIRIEMNQDDNGVRIIFEDNGVGFPEGMDFRNTETLGLQLVNMLVAQLDGAIEMVRNGGTRYVITLKT